MSSLLKDSVVCQYFRTDMIVTALLHDTIEDTTLTEKMIAYIFGRQVASQVQDLTRIKIDRKISAVETFQALFRLEDESRILDCRVAAFSRLLTMTLKNFACIT